MPRSQYVLCSEVLLYCFCSFLEIPSASLLKNVAASRPIPPVVERMRGIKTPCSTSWTRWAYSRFFRIWLMFTICSSSCHGAVAWRIWVVDPNIEKCVLASAPKTSSTDIEPGVGVCVGWSMSEWLIGEGLEEWLGCNIMISVSSVAVISQISLWRMVGIPPIWHVIGWSTKKEVPQLHERGVLLRFHPYLRHSASRNSPLCRKNPCSVTAKTVSHPDDPFSWASSTECCRCGFNCSSICCACCPCSLLLTRSHNHTAPAAVSLRLPHWHKLLVVAFLSYNS